MSTQANSISIDYTDSDEDAVVRGLRDMIFDRQWGVHERARSAVASTIRPVVSGESHRTRVFEGYRQLRKAVDALGRSSVIASDSRLVFALFDWAAVAAPDMFPLLSGHLSLTVGAIQRLGDRTAVQRAALARLDDGGHVGVLLLTELGYGTNVLELRTEARWDSDRRHFVLHTPDPIACKFMPNVGEESILRTVVVAARLIVDDRDEGVFPFLLTLRDANGLAPGVSVYRLPDKGFCPMDNAMIRFDHVPVEEGAWLSGGIAFFDENGEFHCETDDLRDRFRRSTEQLQIGRVALAAGALAAARAATWLTVRYAHQRHTAHRIPMIARKNVAVPLVRAVARLYATTALGNVARAALSGDPDARDDGYARGMLAKPLLSATALSVLQECRERFGAQGMFRDNMISDYIGLTQAVITAEGENQMLRVAAGRVAANTDAAALPRPAAEASPSSILLGDRARRLAGAAGEIDECTALTIADAVAVAYAAHALHDEARRATGQSAVVLHTLAELFAIDRVVEHAAWYVAVGRLDAGRVADLLATGDRLSAALVPRLDVLVEAFGVDAELVPSAHVGEDYQRSWLRGAGWDRTW